VDPVRPDHEIVFAARSVAELDRDDAVALCEALDRERDTDGHVTRRLPQERVQLGPMYREARPDGCPQLGDVDLEQQPAAVVAEALARDLDCSRGDLCLQAEDTEGADSVAGQIDPGACMAPCRFALDHLDRDAGPRDHGRQRQPGDTAADDQHAPPIGHRRARSDRRRAERDTGDLVAHGGAEVGERGTELRLEDRALVLRQSR
jgi:hypothetical protein